MWNAWEKAAEFLVGVAGHEGTSFEVPRLIVGVTKQRRNPNPLLMQASMEVYSEKISYYSFLILNNKFLLSTC